MNSEFSRNTVEQADSIPRTGDHVCPWWVGYLLASPVRRLVENPDQILIPHVAPGMTAVDLGCAMGFHSIPLARLVGPTGRVVCVDVQERMLAALRRRARRRGLHEVIETRVCTQDSLSLDDLRGRADIALAFHVVHESQNPSSFLAGCYSTLRPGGRLILVEPLAHVTHDDRKGIFDLAVSCGFHKLTDLALRRSDGVVFEKPGDS